MRTVGYIRVSKEDQPDSPARQRLQIERCAASHGLTVDEWYQDVETPGWVGHRPDLLRLLADAEAGRVSTVIMDEQSRLTRDEPWEFIHKYGYPLRETRAKVISAAQGILNWDDFMGQMAFSLTQHKSQEEIVTLARRTATRLTLLAAEGNLHVGPAPLGYVYELNSNGKRVKLIPGQAEDVARVRELFAAYAGGGVSMAGLAERFGLSRSTIHDMFHNEAYLGTYCAGKVDRANYFAVIGNGGVRKVEPKRDKKGNKRPLKKKGHPVRNDRELWTVIADAHEAIIDRDVWDAVQLRRKANRKNTAPKRNAREYPLSQFLVCGHCGSNFHGTTDKCGRPLYRCRGAQTRKCPNRSVLQEHIIPLIVQAIRDDILLPENMRLLRERLNLLQGEVQQGKDHEELRAQIEALDRKITRTRAAMLAVEDPEEVPPFNAKLKGLKAQRADLEGRLAASTVAARPQGDPIANLEAIAELAADAPAPLLRAALRAAFERVELRFGSVKRGKKTFYPLENASAVLVGCRPGRGRRTGPPPRS